jgi:hypothetical protein
MLRSFLRSGLRYAFVASAASSIAALSACAAQDDSTQVTVLLTSETEIPKELDSLEVVVTSPNGSEVSRVLYDVNNPLFFPASVAVIPRDAQSLKAPVQVELRGFAKGKAKQVFRRALVSYVKGRTLLLRMPLRMACFDFRDCGPTSTCSGGTCVAAKVDETALSDYEPKLENGADKSLCFDEDKCIADSQLIAINDDCTFAMPAAPSASDRPKVNVSVVWEAAKSRVIVLDEGDAIEGWTVEGTRGRLSKGVCISLKDKNPKASERQVPDQALEVRVSSACPSKRTKQPFCTSENQQRGIGAPLDRK